MGIAFFDLDGTITSKDTFLEFIKFSCGRFDFLIGILLLSPYILLYFIRIYPNHKLKELFFTFFLKRHSKTELEHLGKVFGKKRMPDLVYKSAINRIKWHQLKNHRVIIITASSPIWLAYWCTKNKVELIGTNFEEIEGRYTGKIQGKNCYGIEKKKIVQEILSKNRYKNTYGYGDSKSDLHFLEEVKNNYYGAIKNNLRTN